MPVTSMLAMLPMLSLLPSEIDPRPGDGQTALTIRDARVIGAVKLRALRYQYRRAGGAVVNVLTHRAITLPGMSEFIALMSVAGMSVPTVSSYSLAGSSRRALR